MTNVDMKVQGSKLVITCDLNAAAVPSSTGKSAIVASTQGNQTIAGPGGKRFKVGLNLYIPTNGGVVNT